MIMIWLVAREDSPRLPALGLQVPGGQSDREKHLRGHTTAGTTQHVGQTRMTGGAIASVTSPTGWAPMTWVGETAHRRGSRPDRLARSASRSRWRGRRERLSAV